MPTKGAKKPKETRGAKYLCLLAPANAGGNEQDKWGRAAKEGHEALQLPQEQSRAVCQQSE